MPQPEEPRFACIGCGTMNPVGAEVCAGCGHRFGGPASGGINPRSAPLPMPRMSPEPDYYQAPAHRSPYRPRGSALGCFLTGIGILLTIVSSLIAFVVAFFVTCASIPGSDTALLWAFLAGAGASGLVVALAVWIGSAFRGKNR